MRTNGRRYTAAVLLASYLLACIGAWLHVARDSAYRFDSSHVATAHGLTHCAADQDRDTRQAIGRSAESTSWCCDDEHLPAPEHRSDDCNLCRFQLTKKSAEFLPVVTTFSTDCPERLLPDVPLRRVAQPRLTPDSRAPPKSN